MSREHLKKLQDRAQKLLQMSSDEEEINAYTATNKNTRSPAKIDLDDYLFQDDNQERQQESLQDFKNTDIELLKKCIALTNQNNGLRDLIQQQREEIKELKTILQSKTQNQHKLKLQIQSQFSQNNRNYLENNLQKELANLKKEIQEIKMEKLQLRKQQAEIQKQRQRVRAQRQQNELLLQKKINKSKQIEVHHDYTIKTIKNQPEQSSKPYFNEEYYKQKIKRLQTNISEEKVKVTKLCNFINAQIPQLKDKIVQLTAKLDARVSKYLLRDFQY